MKLYTEEQVKRAMLEYSSYSKPTMIQVIDTLKPIELPSDEEIEENLFHQSYEYAYGYKDAFNLIKNKILNQNK